MKYQISLVVAMLCLFVATVTCMSRPDTEEVKISEMAARIRQNENLLDEMAKSYPDIEECCFDGDDYLHMTEAKQAFESATCLDVAVAYYTQYKTYWNDIYWDAIRTIERKSAKHATDSVKQIHNIY